MIILELNIDTEYFHPAYPDACDDGICSYYDTFMLLTKKLFIFDNLNNCTAVATTPVLSDHHHP